MVLGSIPIVANSVYELQNAVNLSGAMNLSERVVGVALHLSKKQLLLTYADGLGGLLALELIPRLSHSSRPLLVIIHTRLRCT